MAFFDKVGATLTSVGNNINTKTKGMVEVSTLNSQLRSCEAQLKSYYEEIGRLYYEKCAGLSEDAEMNQAFAKINEANEAIEHIKQSLKKARGIIICNGCGAEMPNGTVFCSACGCRITESPVQIVNQGAAKKCQVCGTDNGSDAAYCQSCGGKLD